MQLPFSGTRAVFLSLICAGVLTILGVFGMQVQDVGAVANLSTPTTIIGGTQYGQDDDLGKYNIEAWSAEPQYFRRMLYFTLPTGQEVLFAAFVNNAASARLEFRLSYDRGLTWGQPILGASLSLTIADSDNNPVNGLQYEYTVAVSPDEAQPDIWVSLVQSGNSAVIRKLSWTQSPTSGWTIDSGVYIPDSANCSLPACAETAAVALGVQKYGANTVLTGAVQHGIGGAQDAMHIVTCNTSLDCTLPASWQVKRITQSFGGAAVNSPGKVKIAFVPLAEPGAASQMLAAVLMIPRQYNWNSVTGICDASANPGGFIYTQTDDIGTWSAGPQATINAYPLYNIRQNTCAAVDKPTTKPFTFTLAAFNSSASTASLMIAWEGGATSANEATSHAGQVTVVPFQVSLTNGAVTGSSSQQIPGTNYAPALVFAPKVGTPTELRIWLAMHDAANHLMVTDSSVSILGFAAPVQFSGSSFSPILSIFNPTTPSYIPLNSTMPFTLNSELPPIAWSENTANKISFSANNGGNLFGWGWSSNFGWLSLNCANEGLASPVCNFPYGIKVYPPPTAPQTLSGSAPYNTPQERATGIPSLNFNPNGYPLSGFGWSSNAGWFTMDRTYSVHNPTNVNGGPPAQDYNINDVSTDPIAKYVPGTQKIHGWGRFLNLCNFNSLSQQCQSLNGGWVRMRGYWIDSARQSEVSNVGGYVAGAATISIADCTDFSTNPGLGMIGAELFTFSGCAANTLTITSADRPQNSYAQTTKVSNVTDQGYGVDGYWSGSRYEVSGWAWSAEYGWIHFRPTLFAGFAWLETLFGNIYAQEGITLPNPQNAAANRIKTCDTNGDTIANEDCYTATYRIEAGGVITALNVPGTAQNSGLASSAIGYIQTLTDPVTGQPYKILNTPSAGALDPYVSRPSSPSGVFFPTVSPDSTTFRNALGKIDIGALTTFVGTPEEDTHTPTNVKLAKKNRLGQDLYKTDQYLLLPVASWKVTDLANANTVGETLGWFNNHGALQNLESQVVHVQGNLTVDGASGTMANLSGSDPNKTLTLTAANANFPEVGTLVLDQGTTNEEYVSYMDFDGTTFTGVARISSTVANPSHTNGSATVRWAWQLPAGVAGKARTATVVVDGDLNIQYNIFSTPPSNPASIKEVPTIAFIVRGSVAIDKSVNRVDAAFVVLSKDSSANPAYDENNLGQTNGGIFDTGDDVALCDAVTKKCNPLKIKGMLFARQFNFLRVGDQNLESPGEQVTFDSNLLLNPPPGLGDLTKVLPRITRINQ